jgi:tRNA-splicing ligase RtcB
MSRTAAFKAFTWEEGREFLARKRVNLISAGLDEVPMAYKDIEAVMDAQDDLVAKVARFDPRLVRMNQGR